MAICLVLSLVMGWAQDDISSDSPSQPRLGEEREGSSKFPGGGVPAFPRRADNTSEYDHSPSSPWPPTEAERNIESMRVQEWRRPARESPKPGVVSVEQLRSPISKRDRKRLSEAQAALREGRWEEGMKTMKELVAQPSATGYVKAIVGAEYLRHGDVATAAFLLREAAATLPGSAGTRSNLAFALAATGRMDEARAEARQALRLSPGAPKAACILGVLLLNVPSQHLESRKLLQSAQGSLRSAHLALAVLDVIEDDETDMRAHLNQYDPANVARFEVWARSAATLQEPARAFGSGVGADLLEDGEQP